MNKAFKKHGKKKYRETRFIFGWFKGEVERGAFRYLGLNITGSCYDYSFDISGGDIGKAISQLNEAAEEAKKQFVNFSVAAGEIDLENCDSIDRLLDFPVAQRDVYGSDKNSKPNDHCRWDDYYMHWIETDEHFTDRVGFGKTI